MDEWIECSKKLPKEGQVVDVRFAGIEAQQVLFQEGHFWQIRNGPNEGLTYTVSAWRPRQKKGRVIEAHAADGIDLSAGA